MKVVLLSGGSGSRLWPLSNNTRSKQFLKVLSDESGNKISMVQKVWAQIKKAGLVNDSYISTSTGQVDVINNQLRDAVQLIREPERRDTFAAICLAAAYLHSNDVKEDETVCVLPVDPFVEDKFFNQLESLNELLVETNADIGLIGIKPTFPSEKYGYIKSSAVKDQKFRRVEEFVEKPGVNQAKDLIDNGSLWNSGVFAFRLGFILNIMQIESISLDYSKLVEDYKELEKISFDYKVLEKNNNTIVLPYNGYWKDLGTWNTLTDEMSDNLTGKGTISDTSYNTHVVNELDIPVTVVGINNAVVAASPDGILVSDKEESPTIKKYVGQFIDRPRYEERRWGWYTVLDHTRYDEGNEVLTKKIGIKAGKNLSYQMHSKRSELWSIIKGQGVVVLNGELVHMYPGDILKIPISSKHALKAITDMELIEVQTGYELVEEDVIRVESNWERILNTSILYN
jgi:mannose-1-phosphate guanylyltransferase